MKLRNPWGSFEWKGDWSDNSDCWTPELKQRLGLVDADDGTFWMAFDDFKRYFSRVQICKANDAHAFNNFTVHPNRHEDIKAGRKPGYHLIKMVIEGDGDQTFSVSQKGERMFPRRSEYEYSSCRVLVLRSSNGVDLSEGLDYVGGTRGYEERDTYVECGYTAAGVYYVYVEMDWQTPEASKFVVDGAGVEEDKFFNVTSYGRGAVRFVADEAHEHDQAELLEEIFTAKVRHGEDADAKVQDMSSERAPKIKRYSCG